LEPILDPAPPTTLPGISALQALLDALEVHREHPHTLALHDALYDLMVRLRDEPEGAGLEDELEALARAAGLEHPLRGRLLELTGQREAPRERSLEAILAAQSGLPLRDDPLEALELHLQQRQELVHLLEQRQEELMRNLQRNSRTLDLTVGVAALLFLLGGMGWAIAFDWFSVADEPILDEQQDEDPDEEPTPGGRQDRSRRP